MSLTLRSSAFANGQRIPRQYAREGDNVSPQLEWTGEPPKTRSFAIIVEDPDAPRGTFRHWAAYDIPAEQHELPTGAGISPKGPIRMAMNDFGGAQYDGPQPPPGHGTHHYHFRLFALDVPQLEVPASSNARDVVEVARSHAIEETEIVGTFER
jgi:Raf kinase inhibitor-like YbhB/YbcL family protein